MAIILMYGGVNVEVSEVGISDAHARQSHFIMQFLQPPCLRAQDRSAQFS